MTRKDKIMNTISPVILHEQDGVLAGWDDETHGRVQWRTLFSAGLTPTEALTAGVAEIDPGGLLVVHRHAPPEMYFILAGEGIVSIEGQEQRVGANTAVFIPGNALHGIRNGGSTTLRFLYAFAVDSFHEVEYIFATSEPADD